MKVSINAGCFDDQKSGPFAGPVFIEALEKTFSEAFDKGVLTVNGVKEAEISLSFADEAEMSELNGRYRGESVATDVLSFPLWEDENGFNPPAEWEKLPLGDIVVCPETVAQNAVNNDKSAEEEMVLVISHGFLHLIGFDHDTKEHEDRMWEKQEELVRSFFSASGGGCHANRG